MLAVVGGDEEKRIVRVRAARQSLHRALQRLNRGRVLGHGQTWRQQVLMAEEGMDVLVPDAQRPRGAERQVQVSYGGWKIELARGVRPPAPQQRAAGHGVGSTTATNARSRTGSRAAPSRAGRPPHPPPRERRPTRRGGPSAWSVKDPAGPRSSGRRPCPRGRALGTPPHRRGRRARPAGPTAPGSPCPALEPRRLRGHAPGPPLVRWRGRAARGNRPPGSRGDPDGPPGAGAHSPWLFQSPSSRRSSGTEAAR